MRLLNRLVASLLTLAAMLQAAAAEDRTDECVEAAKQLVARMAAGEFEKVVTPFDETMARVLPASKLEEIWAGLLRQHGPLKKATDTRAEMAQQYTLVFVTCEFERGRLDTKVVFNTKNEIGGLFFVPSGKYESPDYVDAATFEEEDATVGRGLLRLPGTLALPNGEGPLPAVVLVHGSGPNDRDETIGPNKPFRDLAHGLASRGIAVLRYEKRTKEHPILMAMVSGSITVKEETIDDAVAAVEVLEKHERIDPERVFVLGHSLGGMLVPRIAKSKDTIAGFIIFAGSTRPLEDHFLEQMRYVLTLDGELTEEEKETLQKIERQVARVKSPELATSTSITELPLGVPASYWLDLRDYDPAKEVKTVTKPILVLHGERDYQVTMEDFAGWKEALAGRDDVKLTSYPHLNHLFIEGEDKSTPQEYSQPGNVAGVVIEDIVNWIAAVEGNGNGPEWTSLFNGKNLDGWVVKCRPEDKDKTGYWKVADGAITAETPPDSNHNYIWLLTEKEYGDFALRLKVQTYGESTGNSGVQVRSRYDDEADWLDGPQVDINPPGPWRCGFIYDETREAKVWLWPDVGRPANAKPEHAPEGWKWSHADDEDAWNDVEIVCRGTRIKTIINGVTIADYDGSGRLDDDAHRSHNVGLNGHIGLQIHSGKQLLIRFKDVELKELE